MLFFVTKMHTITNPGLSLTHLYDTHFLVSQ